MTPNPQDELLDRARKTIRELREKLGAAEARSRPEPIAVIGMGFQFPGAGTDADRLWRMIAEGRDAVRPVPTDRWDGAALFDPEAQTPGKINTRQAAFLDDVRRFDTGFFDITPREAMQMDPQQRIFLETAWHALEDAGLPMDRIAGTQTGVFVGVHNHSADYQAMQFRSPEKLDAWSLTGTAHDVIAGRLAYWLDLRGPAMAVNTACSSSLTAVHLACRSLRANDCSLALAAGVNLLLGPGSTVGAAQLQLLSPDGRCRSFDARAAGMGRGEGCGVIVLKKLSTAIRDGDRVLALVRGSAINQDGRTNGLTAPNGLAQQKLLRLALEDAGVSPDQIGYVETHGTGTALGDPIEVEALAEALGGSQRVSACVLGAVKANLGHLEGAAGVAGLIKAVMVLRHRWIPPVANLETLNPHFALEGTRIEIPRTGRAWGAERARLAGVSSFGFSGTNVHVVIEEAPPERASVAGNGPWPVLVSAQTPRALRALAMAYADRLEGANGDELAAIAYTSAMRRTHHAHRIAVSGVNAAGMASALRARSEGPARAGSTGETRLEQKLAQWEAGSAVKWREFFPEGGRVVDLPQYPFEGKDYWLEEIKDGKIAVQAGIALQTEAVFKPQPPPSSWFYSVEWVEKERDTSKPLGEDPATWLLMGADSALTRSLADSIRAHGDTVVALEPELHHLHQGFGGDGYAKLLAEIAKSGAPLRHAVFVAGEQDAVNLTAASLVATQAILKSGLPVRLWFLMQEADGETSAAAHAALQGFSRVARLELPEIIGGAIEAELESADAVFDEIVGSCGEDRVAFRAGRRWVMRLRRDPCIESAPITLKTDRSYLVTGAFGRFGMEIAQWLAAAGARHLVLVGRRDPAQMGKPEILERVEALRAQGANVHAQACDVADEAQLHDLLTEIDAGGAKLGGVIHAAVSMRFCPLEKALPEDVSSAFRAKLEGAHALDRCTRTRDIDFFVLFGSASATFGLRNGAFYAPANAALAAVAAERRSLGLPGICVEWGYLASGETSVQQEMAEQAGFLPMQADRALASLAMSIDGEQKDRLVADIDWRVLGPALETSGRQKLVEDVFRGDERESNIGENHAATVWLKGLVTISPAERHDRLMDFVAAETQKVFGMAPDDAVDENRGLFAMGMNSLMSVQLKRRLEAGTGLHLPGTLTLTYPSVSALAGYLETAIFGTGAGAPVRDTVPSAGDVELKSLAGMSEEETSAAIAEELAAVQRKLGAIEV